MSIEYDQYLENHRNNVTKGLHWMMENIPELLAEYSIEAGDIEWLTSFQHDASKTEPDEYGAYDRWFYGNDRSYGAYQDFQKAWLIHIHRNNHHWQHWVLMNDDPEEGTVCIPMPCEYVVEMICDWWSFSWKTGNLFEIFKWWEEHEAHIQLHAWTRGMVVRFLSVMREKLEESK